MAVEKKRNLGIDILCCIGVMLLLGLQYMDAVGFTGENVTWGTALPTAVWMFCLSGAPLLASCIGYVLCTRKLTLRYYKILLRLLYIYVICSIPALLMRVTLFNDFLTMPEALQAILYFHTTQTSELIGMYLTLLILAPYINAIFYGLGTRRAQAIALAVCIVIGCLQPTLFVGGRYLLPGWCGWLFPLAAYFGGAYIRKHGKQRSPLLLTGCLAMTVLAETVIAILTSKGGTLYCPWLESIGSLPSLAIGLLLTALLHSRKPGKSAVHNFFMGAAAGALAALLLGDMLIDAALPALDERFPEIEAKLFAGLLVVPVVFILSCVIGLILQAPILLPRLYRRVNTPVMSAAPRRRKQPAVVVPEHTHTEPAQNEDAEDPRHTIRVPVTEPETPVHLTQPEMEKPQGVHETKLPEPQPYVPKHAADPAAAGADRRASAASAAKAAAARREAMTVDQILMTTPKKRQKEDSLVTVSELLKKLSE